MLAIPALCSCITLTVEPRAIVYRPGELPRVATLGCDAVGRDLQRAATSQVASLERGPLRLAIWNIHKEGDMGWQRDLTSLVSGSDVVLLQESVMQPGLRAILEDAGLSWVMASSFVFDQDDVGVLTATRVAPLASCTQRATEPLLRIPKSAVISWLPIVRAHGETPSGANQTLAIVNIHAINFDLTSATYRAQLDALAEVLVEHRGPIIFAGDFNTWNDARDHAVAEIAQRLGLTEVSLRVDQRAVFFRRHLDHIFVRGLQLIDAGATAVTSSDHNPVTATLRVP